MSKSKIGTWIGLILIAVGGAAGAIGHSVPSATVLISLGAALAALGQSLAATASVLLFSLCATGCTKAQGVAIGVATIDATVCVLNHSQEPIEQIVKDYDGVVAEDVVKILDAHKAAEVREQAGMH